MEEQLISFKIAKLAKGKGFNLPVPHCFIHQPNKFIEGEYQKQLENYELELFSYFLGGSDWLSEIYEEEKSILKFDTSFISNESETYFNYNQDIRKLLARKYNGIENMYDEKCYNMNVDSYTYEKWSAKEEEEIKISLPNYNDGDFSFSVYTDIISAPTQSLLQKWLREVHGIFIYILPDVDGQWGYGIMLKDVNHTQSNRFELDEIIGTYEEALESGLQKALELIK